MVKKRDRITFQCTECGLPVAISELTPPKSDEVISCFDCGHEFGTYGEVKTVVMELAKGEIDAVIEETFGKRPDRTRA
ncbi:hypothetical protein [Ruegeria hyattellae]|uniref:hypothetical protein n=1 Tax=Ruegeria hyattellae TaxID=3233337 RepID=UPI00355AE328